MISLNPAVALIPQTSFAFFLDLVVQVNKGPIGHHTAVPQSYPMLLYQDAISQCYTATLYCCTIPQCYSTPCHHTRTVDRGTKTMTLHHGSTHTTMLLCHSTVS